MGNLEQNRLSQDYYNRDSDSMNNGFLSDVTGNEVSQREPCRLIRLPLINWFPCTVGRGR
jgi:hypothetical protein